MAQESVENLLSRFEKANANKELYMDTYEAAYRYANPVRNIFHNKTKGDPKLNGMYDSTGIRSLYAWVTNMQNAITPPFKRWCMLRPGPGLKKVLKDAGADYVYEQIEKILETATERGFSILNSNNFNTVVPAFYADLAAGTAVLLTIENPIEDPIPMRFVAVPLEEVALEAGPSGTVGATFRKSKVTAQNIEKTWPDAKIPFEVGEKIKNDPTCEICILECFYEKKKKNYYDVIVEDKKDRIVTRVFDYDPFIITRLNPDPVGVYGYGPLVMATPDIRTLNKAKELMLRSSQLSVYGVYTVADNDVVNPNTLKIQPNTFIPVSRNSGPNGPSIAPLPVAGNFNAQQFQIQELQANVREMLFDDKLPSDTGPVRSATEIVERIQNIRKTTGAFFGPINQEFIQHLWQNILQILVTRGEINLDVQLEDGSTLSIPEIANIDNFFVEIDVLSPIAKEQDLEDVQTFVQTYELVAQLLGPEQAQMNFKVEDIAGWLSEKAGIPTDLLRSAEEKEEIMFQQQQAQQMQMLAEQEQQAEQPQPEQQPVL
jgi:hypothetical protein